VLREQIVMKTTPEVSIPVISEQLVDYSGSFCVFVCLCVQAG